MATSTKTAAASQGGGAANNDTDKKGKKKVIRSPKWPFLTFNEAVSKAMVIYKHENKAPTTPAVIFQHLGFKKKTGPAGRTLSALGQYGLLDKKEKGSYAISERAFRLFHLPDESPEREQIQRDLAMRPALFKEIVAKYSATGLPSDSTLKSYLVLDREFNANTADAFIKIFKAAINVAKPFDGAYTPPEEEEEEEEEDPVEGFETPIKQGAKSTPSTPPPTKGQMSFPLYFREGLKGMLYVPDALTREQYQLLKTQIQNYFAVMEATILAEEPEKAS